MSRERERAEYLPIADYGLLADCNSAALVEPRRLDRLALPARATTARRSSRGSSDPEAGHWSIRPAGAFEAERRYLPGTLVIETTFTHRRPAPCG